MLVAVSAGCVGIVDGEAPRGYKEAAESGSGVSEKGSKPDDGELSGSGTGTGADSDNGGGVTFADVETVILDNCAGCHSAGDPNFGGDDLHGTIKLSGPFIAPPKVSLDLHGLGRGGMRVRDPVRAVVVAGDDLRALRPLPSWGSLRLPHRSGYRCDV